MPRYEALCSTVYPLFYFIPRLLYPEMNNSSRLLLNSAAGNLVLLALGCDVNR